MKESVGQSSNQKTGENQLKPEQAVPSIQSKMVNNDPQPKLQPSETADDAKISHIPAPAVPQQPNPEKQRIAQQPTNVTFIMPLCMITNKPPFNMCSSFRSILQMVRRSSLPRMPPQCNRLALRWGFHLKKRYKYHFHVRKYYITNHPFIYRSMLPMWRGHPRNKELQPLQENPCISITKSTTSSIKFSSWLHGKSMTLQVFNKLYI